MRPTLESCDRALLVRLSHLGDVVHALPVFHALRRAAPRAELAWAVQPEFAGLLTGLPGLDRVIPFDRRGGLGAWWRLAGELRCFGADVCVDAQGNLKSAATTGLSRASRRVGWHAGDWRERAGAWVLTESAARHDGPPHALDRSLHLARHIAGEDFEPPEDWLGLSMRERDAGRVAWRERMGAAPAGAVLLQLSAPGDVRAWPAANQLEFLRLCASEGRPTLALSGPAEAELGERVAREVPQVRHWVGQRGLRELAAFFSAASEDGARLVSVDSGPAHLACAVGLSVVGLAGPQDAARTGPWPAPGAGSPHLALRANRSPDCAPCLSRRCAHLEGNVCMEALEAREVLASLEANPRARRSAP